MYSGYLKCFVMRHLALLKSYVECFFFTQKNDPFKFKTQVPFIVKHADSSQKVWCAVLGSQPPHSG